MERPERGRRRRRPIYLLYTTYTPFFTTYIPSAHLKYPPYTLHILSIYPLYVEALGEALGTADFEAVLILGKSPNPFFVDFPSLYPCFAFYRTPAF